MPTDKHWTRTDSIRSKAFVYAVYCTFSCLVSFLICMLFNQSLDNGVLMVPKRRAINLSWFFICLFFSKSLLIKFRTRKWNSSSMRNLANNKLVFSVTSYERPSVLPMKTFVRCGSWRHLFRTPVTPTSWKCLDWLEGKQWDLFLCRSSMFRGAKLRGTQHRCWAWGETKLTVSCEASQ